MVGLLSLLAAEAVPDEAVEALLAPVGFAEWRSAYRTLRRMAAEQPAAELLSDGLAHLLLALGSSASPDRVLTNFERFVQDAVDPLGMLTFLRQNPRTIEILFTLFAGSQFLTEILLRNPEYFERLAAHQLLARPKSGEQYYEDARCTCGPFESAAEKLAALRRYQRWELLRLGTCDLLNLVDIPVLTGQLANLADGLVQLCLDIVSWQTSIPEDGFVVIGMGKLGGGELNYSSDIDLLFLTQADPGEYLKLAERLIDALAGVTAEGFLYRVDMRLRPWGNLGALVSSLDGYTVYLEKHARLWEKQALLKARPVAGDMSVGHEFLRRTVPFVYGPRPEDGPGFDWMHDAVFEMKQRTEAQLRTQGRQWGEVKLGEGSIRDIEFVAQYLQLAHGARQPEIRSRNTLDALRRLAAFGWLTSDEQRVLKDGYVFLRAIEHHLQMMHYRQTHSLPAEPEALAQLARRLGFQGGQAGEQFIARYQQHSAAVRTIYLRHVGKADMSTEPQSADSVSERRPTNTGLLRSHIERMDPSYSATFSEYDIQHHAVLAGQLDEDHLAFVDTAPLDDGFWRVSVVAFDYPGELSLICGLMFIYGINIYNGEAFTYEPTKTSEGREGRRKLVDVFTVRSEDRTTGAVQEIAPDLWARYADDLAALLRLMHAGQRREARGELAKRVAVAVQEMAGEMIPLYPVDIEIDNDTSPRYTLLHISAPDTIGFLYEFTNALAYSRIYIARVTIDSQGDRVQDTLYVTDDKDQKITAPEKQRELRAATVLIKHFTHLLPHSPNPESALLHFREFIGQLFQRPNWPDELTSLERPEVLDGLARLLGVSDFLWDDFLRMQYANLYPVVRDVDALGTAKSRLQLQTELEAILRTVHDGPQAPRADARWREVLNAFKDREMFRIDMRHLLGHTQEFWDFSEELTDLAEVVVNSTYHLTAEDLRCVYGTPYLEDGTISQMAVLALGKFGGRELGFASDIELMFVYTGNGVTGGTEVIATAEFQERVVQSFLQAIRARREGIFEVDMQLRPYGKAGSMAVSLEAFKRYFAPGGPAWAYERQALVKLRSVAGDDKLGQAIAGLRDEFVYTGQPFDVTAMRAMRERQIRHLVKGGSFNSKFSPGGLVDLEYLVQGLQITYGHQYPDLRSTNTRQTLAALAEAGLISVEDYTRLRKSYTFLRWLIDSLRVVRGNAKDMTLPLAHSEEFAFLARRLRYGADLAHLQEDLHMYTGWVLELNARLLGQ